MEAPTVTTDSTVVDIIDNATMVQDNQVSGSAMTVTSVDVDVPGARLASGTAPAATVTHEEDVQALRTVSPSTSTNMIVAQSVQMFHGSSNSEFNNGRFNNVGRDNNVRVYHIHGNTTIHCSSTDLANLVNSASSPLILQDTTSSQPEHVKRGDIRAGSTSVTEDNGSGTQTGITTPRRVQRGSSACEDHSGPRTQGKEDQQATPAADEGQNSKSGLTIYIDRVITSIELRFLIAFFF
ncbi:hypothetical protein K435DRAFT_973691 [Dendrothele bispora CBS 962.96]|uniref:Uncharacterized protein n=1 Tax=Dendrothele bispora (strain CBS 962.96) TaxID=1314807 RepID=A0A4S8KQX5_DENBC|nr:hypothetical protein K435DRAFT_973691 [Dendrothele bispora CBS 962.96]